MAKDYGPLKDKIVEVLTLEDQPINRAEIERKLAAASFHESTSAVQTALQNLRDEMRITAEQRGIGKRAPFFYSAGKAVKS